MLQILEGDQANKHEILSNRIIKLQTDIMRGMLVSCVFCREMRKCAGEKMIKKNKDTNNVQYKPSVWSGQTL